MPLMDRTPSEYPVFTSQSEVLSAFSSGTIGVVDARVIFDENVLGELTFEKLSTLHAKKRISNHSKFSFDKQGFSLSWTIIEDVISRLNKLEGKRLPSVANPNRLKAYGVVNTRRILSQSPIQKSFKRNFAHGLSFLWLGLSPGGLHFDHTNNVLVQLSGRKRVICFSPSVADRISTQIYIVLRNFESIFASENLSMCPGLAKVPYYDIELNPGDALVLPSAAYHSPLALSRDCVSLNTFLTTRSNEAYLNNFARKKDALPWVVTNAAISLSKLYYRLFGRPLRRSGPYEEM